MTQLVHGIHNENSRLGSPRFPPPQTLAHYKRSCTGRRHNYWLGSYEHGELEKNRSTATVCFCPCGRVLHSRPEKTFSQYQGPCRSVRYFMDNIVRLAYYIIHGYLQRQASDFNDDSVLQMQRPSRTMKSFDRSSFTETACRSVKMAMLQVFQPRSLSGESLSLRLHQVWQPSHGSLQAAACGWISG